MPIRSSPAAKKAMYDGDLLECRTTSSDVNTRSTKSQASSTPDPSRLLLHNPIDASTRTCRNDVADGTSLLHKQKAEVWNRPSLARPEVMWRRQHAIQSLTEVRDDLLECLTTSSAVNTSSTKSQASSTPGPRRLLLHNPIDASSRTCRNDVADGQSLLHKQKAEVWNRPSLARPEVMWRRQHASLMEVRDERETARLNETNADKQKKSLQALPTLSTRATNARISLSKRLETSRGNMML